MPELAKSRPRRCGGPAIVSPLKCLERRLSRHREVRRLTLSTVAAASGEDVCPFDISSTGKPVFRAFAEARRKFGGKRVCIFDVDDSPRTYDDIMRGALAL